jgi:hypothetical protein
MLLNARLIVSTFVMIFLAELGDKTQISTFALATNSRSMLSVFLGASGALVLTTLIAVVLGGGDRPLRSRKADQGGVRGRVHRLRGADPGRDLSEVSAWGSSTCSGGSRCG